MPNNNNDSISRINTKTRDCLTLQYNTFSDIDVHFFILLRIFTDTSLFLSFLCSHTIKSGNSTEKFLDSVEQRLELSSTISALLIQRDSVLDFLSACPPLMDLECWSQWYATGFLEDRWGKIEDFLLQCGPQKGK